MYAIRSYYAAVFSFGQNSEGYYLQFRTDYYRKDYNTTEEPILKYSVFCKKSSDPVVKNAVVITSYSIHYTKLYEK